MENKYARRKNQKKRGVTCQMDDNSMCDPIALRPITLEFRNHVGDGGALIFSEKLVQGK
jgi:hypothetical protein